MQIKEGETTALILFDQSSPKDVKEAVEYIEGAKELGFYVSSSSNGSYSLRKKKGFVYVKQKDYSPANRTRYTGVRKAKNGRFIVGIKIDGYVKTLGDAETPKAAFQIRLDYIEDNKLEGYVNGKRIGNFKKSEIPNNQKQK